MNPTERDPLSHKGEWAAYMCPACRGLFRAPAKGSGPTRCPLCESEIQVEVNPSSETEDKEEEAIQPLQRRRRYIEDNEQTWDQAPSQRPSNASNKGLILTSLFLLSIGVVGGSFFLLKLPQDRKNKTSASISNPSQIEKLKSLSSPASSPGKNGKNNPEEPLIELVTNDLEAARKAAEQFLSCETIADMEPLIRDAERVMPLLREYYYRKPFEPVGARTIDEQGIAQVAKRFTSFEIVLKNYATKPIAVELTSKGPLIDWESWVAHCEQPWELFIEREINDPTLVRVTAKQTSYFNFDFRDDKKWACFRLARSPDEQVLYGYAPRDAPFLKNLPGLGDPESALRLKIRYPDHPVADNQVLITEFVGSGWVKGL